MSGSVPSFGAAPKPAVEPAATEGADTEFLAEWRKIRPSLEAWEKQRRSTNKIVKLLWVGIAICFGIPFLLWGSKDGGTIPAGEGGLLTIFIVGGIACVAAMVFVSSRLSPGPIRQAKSLVLGHLGFFYDPAATRFPFDDFKRLYLVERNADFRIADMIDGKVSGIAAQICSIEKFEKRRRRRRNTISINGIDLGRIADRINRHRERTERFKGGLIVAGYPKTIQGCTVIMPNDLHPRHFFSEVFQDIGERVKLESEDFNSAFIVYSTDQVEARYLLTPGMMERLLRLRKPTVREFAIAFEDGRIRVAFNDGRTWFPDAGDDGDATDPGYLGEMRKAIDYIEVIFREMDVDGTNKV